jgi:peptidoglycan/LPS O-acetylase OafA/YrhL
VPLRSKNTPYLPGIDHLRAFASVLIVLYHGRHQFLVDELARRELPKAKWPVASRLFDALLYEGHTAVAMFMVLSGFIFTHGLGEQRLSARGFCGTGFCARIRCSWCCWWWGRVLSRKR